MMISSEQKASAARRTEGGLTEPTPQPLSGANLEAQYRAFALGRQWGWLSVN